LAYQSPKVLVIDATLQSWETTDDASMEADDDSCNPMNAIQYDPERGVDYLVSFMPRRSTKFTSRMLNRFLKEAKSEYDFICIDSSPILQSDLTEYLAANCDAGVLIIQGDSSLYKDVRRSAEILIRLDIPALAPVLNWGGVKNKPWFEKHIDTLSAIISKVGFGSRSATKLQQGVRDER